MQSKLSINQLCKIGKIVLNLLQFHNHYVGIGMDSIDIGRFGPILILNHWFYLGVDRFRYDSAISIRVDRVVSKSADSLNHGFYIVQLEQGTMTSLLWENNTVKGVTYKTQSGKQHNIYESLIFLCGSNTLNLQHTLCNVKVNSINSDLIWQVLSHWIIT